MAKRIGWRREGWRELGCIRTQGGEKERMVFAEKIDTVVIEGEGVARR